MVKGSEKVESDNKVMFSCKSCTKKYKRKKGISRHVKQKHETQPYVLLTMQELLTQIDRLVSKFSNDDCFPPPTKRYFELFNINLEEI